MALNFSLCLRGSPATDPEVKISVQEIYSLSTPGRLRWKLGKQDREGEEAKQIATSKAHRSSFSLTPQRSCGGDLMPLNFPHSKKRRWGFPTLAPLIQWLRATPERWKFPGASCPWKCKKSPPLAEGSKNTLKLAEGSGEHHTEKVQRYPRRSGKSMDIIPYSL